MSGYILGMQEKALWMDKFTTGMKNVKENEYLREYGSGRSWTDIR
jgi:hypothetical protein